MPGTDRFDEIMPGACAINTRANRRARKYTRLEMLRRMLWGFGKLCFRLTPRPCFSLRRCLLRFFGAEIGKEVHIYNSALIYFPWNLKIGDWSSIGEGALIYNLGLVTIGQSVTISQRAHLCAGSHDYRRPDLPLLKLPVTIHDEAWICADAFVGPETVVGAGAVVGARAVVVKNVEPWTVVAGNPARFLSRREMAVK